MTLHRDSESKAETYSYTTEGPHSVDHFINITYDKGGCQFPIAHTHHYISATPKKCIYSNSTLPNKKCIKTAWVKEYFRRLFY